MAVGYGAVTFDVQSDDGYLPRVVPGEDRLGVYTATITLASTTALDSLDALLSYVTVKTALGRRGGKVVVDTGPGTANLVIPVDDGTEETWTAILTGLAPTAWHFSGDYVTAEATWLCLERTVP